ncbi:MAG: sigma-70 family RNA polymerase sigma factor [Candidatus Poribacteria bacterium]|nr:sigma-70 family RNA polymerase sigma factor [Candidatus Poribacteria bacterium]
MPQEPCAKQPTDAELIAQHLNGSAVALSQLWVRYDRVVYGIAHSVLSRRDAAEDIRQEVFLKTYEHLDNLRDSAKFVSWLRNVTYNACYGWLRKQRPTTTLDALTEGQQPTTPSGAGEVEQRELRTLLRQMIDRLPEALRTVIELRYFEGLEATEIAEFLELPLTTIRWRLRKARETLQRTAAINGYLD